MNERLDEMAAERLENLEVYPVGDRKPKRDPWLTRSLKGETKAGRVAGLVVDIASSFLPRGVDRALGIIRQQTERPMKKAIRRALSGEGGSLIRVRDENGNIDTTAIAATLIRVAIILLIYYAATWLGLGPAEILSVIG